MRRRVSTLSRLAPLLVSASVAGSATAQPLAPELGMRVACEAPELPGRVRCDVELHAPAAGRLAWSDVLVVSAPSATRPLRSRVVGHVGQDGVGRAVLAFVASTTGVFPVLVRGRATVCRQGQTGAACRPVTHDTRVEMRVGTAPKPPSRE